MRDVVLLYERSCPNVRAARTSLLRAFSKANLPAEWREINIDAPDTPPEWRAYGSPTVLVDGRDVVGVAVGAVAQSQGATCRLYEDEGKLARAPSVDRIVASLRGESVHPATPNRRSGIRSALAAAPGVGIALLPKIACPACWPAYAAALSAVGLGFLMQARYLLPITSVLLVLATFAIAFRARSRRGFAPAIVAGSAAATLLVAKFILESDPLTYAATVAFASAAIWNAWPQKDAAGTACVPSSSSSSSSKAPTE